MRTTYDTLPIVPALVADAVVSQPSADPRAEPIRANLTPEQRREFADLCDSICRAAFDARAPWFMKIARSKTNHGRDQLFMWVRTWRDAYCLHRDFFMRHVGAMA